MSEASPVGTTISASANLTAPLEIIALDNDIEEVEREQLYTLHVSTRAYVHKTQSTSSVLIKY